MDIRSLFRENIKNLAPYSTARDEYKGDIGTYLDANENPYDSGYNRYPDPYQSALKERISKIKGVPVDNIFIGGSGSDEAIDISYRVFCEPRIHNVVSISPSYGMYKVAANINDVEFREVALEDDFALDAEKILAAADANTRLIFLCSPNNPSGNFLNEAEVLKIVKNFKGVVVLDEAYIDFTSHDGFLGRLADFPNLIILQTLSKAWGMAGLRVGFAFASREIIEVFTKVKYPYNMNIVTQKLVLDLLREDKTEQIRELKSERERVVAELSRMSVIKKLFPTDANFVLAKVDDPRRLYDMLIGEGLIVRDRSRIKGCEGCLRITVGTPQENDKLIKILKNVK